jgi:hypothetical protein
MTAPETGPPAASLKLNGMDPASPDATSRPGQR